MSTERSSDVSHDTNESNNTQTSLQRCTSAGETSSTATTTAGGERSFDNSCESNESDNEIFSTPPQTPVGDDRVLVSHIYNLH